MTDNTSILRGRFAPSPTGRMHLGNVFSALLSYLSVKSKGGEWLLRIEDIDPQRSHREYAEMLMDDLCWLGLEWDGEPVYQSERSEIYERYFEELAERGMTYPCYCTRADLLATQAPHETDGRVVYRGTCRNLPPQPGKAAATRLIVPDEDIPFTDGHYGCFRVNLTEQVGDFIIRRKDGAWAYQLLGFASPQFIHLPLLCNSDCQRLSKRDRSLDMGSLRSRYQSSELLGLLAFLAGLQPKPDPVSAKELVAQFSWDKVPTKDIITQFE